MSETRPKLLDLFCCAGGAGAGYYLAGFDVVGVDKKPQPRYPFKFIQADALEYLRECGDCYDAIHASPPCQEYSVTKSIHGNTYPDLIAPTRELLIATGKPYVIENVPGAPLFNYLELDGTMFGLRVIRKRLFESNILLLGPTRDIPRGRTARRGEYDRGQGGLITVAGNNFCPVFAGQAMGIGWMTRAELAQAIPPAYTEFIGKQLILHT